MDLPVCRTQHVLQRQIDLSVDAGRAPQENMRSVFAELVPPVAFTHGQGVSERDRPFRGTKGGLEHHRPVQVAAGDLGGIRCPERPVAGLVAEKATEDGRAVEAGKAQPVDGPFPADERRAVPIRKERIVGDGDRAHGELLRS